MTRVRRRIAHRGVRKLLAIGLLFDLRRENEAPPFDRLRANGFSTESVENFPFVLSLSKHEQR